MPTDWPAVAIDSPNGVSILEAIGGGDFGPPSTYGGPNETRDATMADVDADGRPDLIVGGLDQSFVLFNRGDLPTPVQMVLLATDVTSDRVRLTWSTGGDAGVAAWVERREADDEWRNLGRVRASHGILSFEDASIVAGRRDAYRLRLVLDGDTRWLPETWVDVPGAAELAIDGVHPNPASVPPRVDFRLTDGRPARLELIDVAGRIRLRRTSAGSVPAATRCASRRRLSILDSISFASLAAMPPASAV
jgi:hypothetical protein